MMCVGGMSREPLHSPYVEGAVILYRANHMERDEQYVSLVPPTSSPLSHLSL